MRDSEDKVVVTGVLSVTSRAQVLLLSQDYGKHLLGVEDLLQKHALVEADIGIQAERVRGVNASAQKFATDGEGEQGPFHTFPPGPPGPTCVEADKLCVATGLRKSRRATGHEFDMLGLSWVHESLWGSRLSPLALSCFSQTGLSSP